MRMKKVIVNVAGITQGDGIAQKWFVWRQMGNVINGLFWGKCIGKWKLEIGRSVIKSRHIFISLATCLSVIVYMSAGNNTAWNLPCFGIPNGLLYDTP
jgi:hypothetical protein